MHWDPAKSEYFYYFYDTSDVPPPSSEDEDYVEVEKGIMGKERGRKGREGGRGRRGKGRREGSIRGSENKRTKNGEG